MPSPRCQQSNPPRRWRRGSPSRVRGADRKSTRLNSSHSLHSALPIEARLNVPSGKGSWNAEPTMSTVQPPKTLASRFTQPGAWCRSEEHTSELQSLPTLRSSDRGTLERPVWEGQLECRAHDVNSPTLQDVGVEVHPAGCVVQIGRAHV